METETIELENRKVKRQRRIQQKHNHIKRQVKIAKAAGQEIKEEHRFAKHNALDCGIPRCHICNPTGKRQPTIQEKKIKEFIQVDEEISPVVMHIS
jgi:predicted RNA-binding Zn-ribbon protein involved in translation (DUF1610 family)